MQLDLLPLEPALTQEKQSPAFQSSPQSHLHFEEPKAIVLPSSLIAIFAAKIENPSLLPLLENPGLPVPNMKKDKLSEHRTLAKAPDAFKTISEAANVLGVPQHVLRFWESRFSQIRPLKLGGGRRYYRPEDMEILSTIKHLLYKQGYTIKGARKAFSSRRKGQPDITPDIFQDELPPFPPLPKRKLTNKQRLQLSTLQQELLDLQQTLETVAE